ncbi:MAG: hypothetical protein ABFS14_05655 [Gemmatimonadota bacterium]
MMRASRVAAVLAAGLAVAACSGEPTSPAADSQATAAGLQVGPLAAVGSTATPLSFVATFNGVCAIPGFDESFQVNGASGRAKARFAIGFDLSGDLIGSSCLFIDANLTSASGPQDFFTTSTFDVVEACVPSRGICGEWQDRLPGKINVDPSIGVESVSHGVMLGVSGDAEGTRILVESFVECSPAGTGCGEGVLLEPGV